MLYVIPYCSEPVNISDSHVAENSVFANLLKDEGFCFLALCPGWTETDMGADTAQKLGLKAAPLTVDTSIKQQLEILKSLTPDNNGEFVNYEGTIDW